MMSTISLTMMLYTVHFPAVVYKMSVELSGWTPFITKLKSTLALARNTINVAPMLVILFIGARMHALQVDSKHDSPQRWVVCFYDCITSVCVQTLPVILVPFCSECECKEGPSGSDGKDEEEGDGGSDDEDGDEEIARDRHDRTLRRAFRRWNGHLDRPGALGLDHRTRHCAQAAAGQPPAVPASPPPGCPKPQSDE